MDKQVMVDRHDMSRPWSRPNVSRMLAAGTTYDGWHEHGPQLHWDEVIADSDDAVWDQLVKRCVREAARPREVAGDLCVPVAVGGRLVRCRQPARREAGLRKRPP